MNLSNTKYNALVTALTDCGYEVNDYSGRGMYGKRCISVVTDDSLAVVICNVLETLTCQNLISKLEFDVFNVLKSTNTDSMGLSSVVYWPMIGVS